MTKPEDVRAWERGIKVLNRSRKSAGNTSYDVDCIKGRGCRDYSTIHEEESSSYLLDFSKRDISIFTIYIVSWQFKSKERRKAEKKGVENKEG